MDWEGKAVDTALWAGTPSIRGATLRLSQGSKWGRGLAPGEHGQVLGRYIQSTWLSRTREPMLGRLHAPAAAPRVLCPN